MHFWAWWNLTLVASALSEQMSGASLVKGTSVPEGPPVAVSGGPSTAGCPWKSMSCLPLGMTTVCENTLALGPAAAPAPPTRAACLAVTLPVMTQVAAWSKDTRSPSMAQALAGVASTEKVTLLPDVLVACTRYVLPKTGSIGGPVRNDFGSWAGSTGPPRPPWRAGPV